MTHPRLDLAFLLNQSAYAFGAQLGEALQGVGIDVREYCVLLKAAEDERTQNVIAEMAMLDKSTMVTTLDRLEKAGLAERRVSATDRRARTVSVTAKGRKVLARATEVYDAVVEESLSALDPATRRVFVDALTVLTEGPWLAPSHTTTLRRRTPVITR